MESSTKELIKPIAPATPLVLASNQISKIDLPDHTQLPDSDGTFVKNFQEHPQSIILTSSIEPILQKIHPDGRYCIGQDSGIYWHLTEPLEKGAEAPDWFYVPNVAPLLDGEYRRSYVMWKEIVAPLIAIKFVSGNGSDERDATPAGETEKAGKFWVYEQAIRIPFYAIFEPKKALVEVYHLVDGRYEKMLPNDRGHFSIAAMDVEIGVMEDAGIHWLRWWDRSGNNLLLTGDERAESAELIAEQERLNAEQERFAKEQAEQKAHRLAEKLREMGIDPDRI